MIDCSFQVEESGTLGFHKLTAKYKCQYLKEQVTIDNQMSIGKLGIKFDHSLIVTFETGSQQ